MLILLSVFFVMLSVGVDASPPESPDALGRDSSCTSTGGRLTVNDYDLAGNLVAGGWQGSHSI